MTKWTVLSKVRGMALLSRTWAAGLSEFVNDGAIDAGIEPTRLRKIKAVAQNLKLNFLASQFVEMAHRDMGEFDMAEYVDEDELDEHGHDNTGIVMNAILMAYKQEFVVDDDEDGEQNSGVVELFLSVKSAYQKFLVVKTIETLAKEKPPANYKETPWAEKCCASPLIECVHSKPIKCLLVTHALFLSLAACSGMRTCSIRSTTSRAALCSATRMSSTTTRLRQPARDREL